MNLPNLISLARLLSVPLCVWLLVRGEYAVVFWVFLLAGVSDAVDGFIAKRFNQASQLGAVLDPLADKALLVSVYLTLGQQNHIAPWLVILIVFRDVMILGGVFVQRLFTDQQLMRPTYVSKFNTVAQIVLVIVLLAQLGFNDGLADFVEVLVWLTAATTVSSGGTYLVLWLRQMTGNGAVTIATRESGRARREQPSPHRQ